ncbi:hypothetical protein UJ101_00493 [Flavobacteriaceae bacterium UJ101]|nr:hypothetical protein UJ101_00493 [Flavobacteriaceae bacterium UJ101]
MANRTFFIVSILTLSLLTLNANTNPSKIYKKDPPNALVISWQKNNIWYACGPIQCIKTGEKTEKKALNYVYNEKKDSLEYIEKKGNYKIYSLNRPLKSYDKDVRKRLKQLGIIINY